MRFITVFILSTIASAADFSESVKAANAVAISKKYAVDKALADGQAAYVRRVMPLFKVAPLPVLSADPKASEKAAYDLAKKRNGLAERLASAQDDADRFRVLFTFYTQAQPGMPVLPEFVWLAK